MLPDESCNVFCLSLNHLDDAPLTLAAAHVLDPHHHLVAVNGVVDKTGRNKNILVLSAGFRHDKAITAPCGPARLP